MSFAVPNKVIVPKRFPTRMYIHDVFRSTPKYKYLSKCDTIRYLNNSKKGMYDLLETKIEHIMGDEMFTFEDKHDWDTIEEISMCISKINSQLNEIQDQRECWDDIECLIYD